MIKIGGKVVDINHFPDGTQLLKQLIYIYYKENPVFIEWYYENDNELVALIYLVKHLRDKGIKNIKLFMPYIPNARMDRTKSNEEVFTLKYFADIINWLQFDMVEVLDPHSYVSEALINNIAFTEINIDYIINQHIGADKNITIFYPDSGGVKRYSDKFNKPFTYGEKDRDWSTGKINGLNICGDLDLIKGRNILIVDDICSRGGTFYHSAKKLKELGANEIYLYVSHCENTILEGDLLTSGLIEKVITTNSIFTKEHEKIEVIKL